MSLVNIESLKEKVALCEKLADRNSIGKYVLVPNLAVDFRDLSNIDSIYWVKTNAKYGNYYLDTLFDKIYHLCFELNDKNIPFDGIHISGQPGIIIKSQIYQEILEAYLKNNYNAYIHNKNSYVFPTRWDSSLLKSFISNLKIDDTLYNLVPLNLKFEPFYRIGETKVPISKFLGVNLDGINAFSATVLFNEFINGLSFQYNLMFDDNQLTNYEDYFNHFKNATIHNDHLNFDMDLVSYTNAK